MSAVITSSYVMVHPEELQRLQADLAAATQQVEDVEAQLTAVTAERDALRRAAELGREYARYSSNDYMCNQKSVLEDIAIIDAALRGEVQGE